jgi:acetyl-CoA C-acetyltransferase
VKHDELRQKLAISGAAYTNFGDHCARTFEDLAHEAASAACRNAGIELEEVDAAWLGTYSPYGGSGKASVSLADALRIYGKPITRVENYCATGTDAFRNAMFAVLAGMCQTALVLGVEKLRDRPGRGLSWEGEHPYHLSGLSAPGCFALAANRYLRTFGVGREALAHVAVKNHRNGAANPKAHLRRIITTEQVLEAPIVASPFGLYDCCPTTDGAAALILTTPERARRSPHPSVFVLGAGSAVFTGRPWFDPNFDYLGFPATREAARQAYQMAGIADPLGEIDFAEVHDCFTWTEITNYEDLGFCAKGAGAAFVMEGRSGPAGDLPVNTSGGLKSFGHPIGATGIRMLCELVEQLRHQAGDRQILRAERGLAHNLGGPGSVATVTILGN